LGRSDRRELLSRLKVLLMHLLKWQFQPSARSSGWRGTILEQREGIQQLLEESPSLRPTIASGIAKSYPRAVTAAETETGFARSIFPTVCPWSEVDLLSDEYLPD
jgi:hypothetical protein